MARARRWPDQVTKTGRLSPSESVLNTITGVSMSLLATISAAAEGGHHIVNELPFPAPVFGVITFAIFTALAIVTFSFRDVANRHAAKAEAYAREHGASHHE